MAITIIDAEEQLKKFDRYNDDIHIKPYFDKPTKEAPYGSINPYKPLETIEKKMKNEWTTSVFLQILTLIADFKEELSEEIAKTHIFEIPRLKTIAALRAFEKFETRVTELRTRL